ncbi:hypothetical protein [Deinococcus sp. PESE-13]
MSNDFFPGDLVRVTGNHSGSAHEDMRGCVAYVLDPTTWPGARVTPDLPLLCLLPDDLDFGVFAAAPGELELVRGGQRRAQP